MYMYIVLIMRVLMGVGFNCTCTYCVHVHVIYMFMYTCRVERLSTASTLSPAQSPPVSPTSPPTPPQSTQNRTVTVEVHSTNNTYSTEDLKGAKQAAAVVIDSSLSELDPNERYPKMYGASWGRDGVTRDYVRIDGVCVGESGDDVMSVEVKSGAVCNPRSQGDMAESDVVHVCVGENRAGVTGEVDGVSSGHGASNDDQSLQLSSAPDKKGETTTESEYIHDMCACVYIYVYGFVCEILYMYMYM